jgi:hypothetical protein
MNDTAFTITLTKPKIAILISVGLAVASFALAAGTGNVYPWACVASIVTGVGSVIVALFWAEMVSKL